MANTTASEAAAGVLEDMFGDGSAEAQAEEPASEPANVNVEAEDEAQQEAVVEETPELPEDIQTLLDEPDFEEEAEEEVEDEQVEGDPEDQVYTDPDLARERKARLAAEKKLKWMEDQRVQREAKSWKQDAQKYLPHSAPFLDKIEATSKRGFFKQAKEYHELISEYIDQAGTPDLEKIRAEERARLEAAWGTPTTGPGSVPVEAGEAQEKWEQARVRGDQLGMIKARGYHHLVD